MINWKIVAVFPAFAVMISILAGGLGGADIADIVIRTIIWGILFSGIGVGVNVILNKYFPEILDIFEADESRIKESSAGDKGFETYIPEENPHELEEMKYERSRNKGDYSRQKYSEGESAISEENEDASELSEIEDKFPDFSSKSSGVENKASEDEIENGLEESINGFKPIYDESNEEPDTSSETFKKIDNKSDDDSSLVFDEDGLDSLPEFGSSNESFSGASSDTPFESESSFSKPSKNPKAQGFEQDPHKTAKAIHTMIQRDKEG